MRFKEGPIVRFSTVEGDNEKESQEKIEYITEEATLKDTSMARTLPLRSSSLLPSGLLFVQENYCLDFVNGKNATGVHVGGIINEERTSQKDNHVHHSQSCRDNNNSNNKNSKDKIDTLKPSSDKETAWQLFHDNLSNEEFIDKLVKQFPELDHDSFKFAWKSLCTCPMDDDLDKLGERVLQQFPYFPFFSSSGQHHHGTEKIDATRWTRHSLRPFPFVTRNCWTKMMTLGGRRGWLSVSHMWPWFWIKMAGTRVVC
jgi:hypothetical protein